MSSLTTTRRADRRRLLQSALLAPLLGGVAAGSGLRMTHAQEPAKASLALDWYPNASHAGLYLAETRGYFTVAGIDLEIYTPSDPTVILQTVGSGKDTFGISYQTDVLLARAQGLPVVSIAAMVQHPLLGIMCLKEQHITRPADLKGKKVGYPGIPSQEAFLATMLETDGAKLEDVELVNVGFDLVPAAISGQVAGVMGAYWSHETILAEREGYPVDLLRVEEWGVPDYYELVMTASEETVAERADLVTTFLSALARGYTDAVADPAASLEALETASDDIEPEVEEQGIAALVPVWVEGSTPFGHQDPARWSAYAAWMVGRGLIPADLDVEAAFTTELLPEGTATPAA